MKVILQNSQDDKCTQTNIQLTYEKLNISAFSLIELSIVLIIIGFLVSGIAGTASLIETSKVQYFVNKTYDWKRNINTFYSLKGRLPGNLNNNYYLGSLYTQNNNPFSDTQSQSYKIADFGISKYDTLSGSTSISYCGAFWLDLYLAKISDFQPTRQDLVNCNTIGTNLNVFNGDLRMLGPKTIIFNDNKGYWKAFLNAMKGVYFQFIDNDWHMKPRLFFKIDKKLDDGLYDNGDMRSFCYTNRQSSGQKNQIDYQTAINFGKTCHDFYYKLIDYKML